MPVSDLSNVVLLGDEPTYSREIFGKLFETPAKMTRFKHYVSTSKDRWKNRAFSRTATFTESLEMVFKGRTDYGVILRDLKDNERSGSLAHVANFRFMVNASHAALLTKRIGNLQVLASDQRLITPADYLHQPLHRLLVEEHVFAFVWSPIYSRSYHALRAVVAAARLASAAASTVASLGATAPALISSLQSAADVAHDLIKLKGAVSESITHLQAIKGELEAVAEPLSELHSGVSAVRSGGGSLGSDLLMPATQGGTLDLTARGVNTEVQSVKRLGGILGTRAEKPEERARRIRKEVAALEQQAGSLNFVVVQHIVPVIQHRDNVEVSSSSTELIDFNFKTYLANKALVRVGETSRDAFNQLVAAAKADALGDGALANLVCYPWMVAGEYLQYIRTPRDDAQGPRQFPSEKAAFVKWDLTAPEWILVDEKPATMPMPESLRKARRNLEARMREKQEAAAREAEKIRNRLVSLGFQARGALLAREHERQRSVQAAQQERLRKINSVLAASQIPRRADFVLQTTTRTGPFKNSRDNPKLLTIDLALVAWEKAKLESQTPGGVEQLRIALQEIVQSCEIFTQSKLHQAQKFMGHRSERLTPVYNLRDAALRVYRALD